MSSERRVVKLVGVVGRAGVGKDTAVDLVKEESTSKIVHLSFAEPIKEAVRYLFLLDEDAFTDRAKKEAPDSRWGDRSPRNLAQWIGTDVFRNQFDVDFWTKRVRFSILAEVEKWRKDDQNSSSGTLVVMISDVRFPNEAEFLLDIAEKLSEGGQEAYAQLWSVTRPSLNSTDMHESERSYDDVCKLYGSNISATIVNDGTLEEYLAKVRCAMVDM